MEESSEPTSLAVDWVTGNLYCGQQGSKTIEVIKLDGLYTTVLVNTGLDDPSSMVVDVRHG